ncbi:MAG: hypothetical protein QXD11_01200 [Candidatus Micrarchaeaceae archaeon]
MRLQLSIEFLIYTAISAASLIVSIFFFSNFYAKIIQSNSKAELETFVSGINEALQAGINKVSLYVPKSLCSANISDGIIKSKYGEFEVLGNISISSNLCNNSGRMEEIIITQSKGNVLLQ